MTRIPLDPPRTQLFRLAEWYARRTYGVLPDPLPAMGHNLRVLVTDAPLRDLPGALEAAGPDAEGARGHGVRGRRSAALGAWTSATGMTHLAGVDPAKMRDVPRWRDSDVYTDLERQVLAYAEAMTATPPTVTDELVAGAATRAGRRPARRAHHDGGRGERPVPVQHGAGADEPGLHGPLRDPGAPDRTAPGRVRPAPALLFGSRTRCWAASRTPRTSSRTPGCAGRPPTATTSPTRGPTWADHHPAGAEPAGLGPRTAGELRRAWLPEPLLTGGSPVAAAPRPLSRTRPPNSASRCRSPCSSSSRRCPRRSGRSSCCARSSGCRWPRWPPPSAAARPPSARWPIAPASTCRRGSPASTPTGTPSGR